MRRLVRAVVLLFGCLLVAATLVWWLNVRGEAAIPVVQAEPASTAGQIERGAYLARAGNCSGCHTDRGGAPYAGGKGIPTPFGTVYASNLTPDVKTGIGSWNAAHFWRAMHHGRSKDGRLLYPAFPYPSFTLITRDDSDALYAFLRSQAPAQQPNQPHALRFPYDMQPALAVWRALFFAPRTFERLANQSERWNRGAYLVRGLGHCDACHAPRNIFGATRSAIELSGGLIPNQHWYAPSLADGGEAGVADWPLDEVVQLMSRGISSRG
ncbi:MAG TPA: cytochrome c, partial [Burkholderiaceae bacterium]|nr:cytochrome c [Burkholderiaceae bacterium]